MLRAVVYNLCLLLIIGSCAKKKQGVGRAHPDPATGVCLGDEACVADPNDIEAALQRALQNQDTLNAEVQSLRDDKKVIAAEIASGERPNSDGGLLAIMDESIIKISEAGQQRGFSLSPEPEVDTSKVPAVTLRLKNKKHTGVRPVISFTHDTSISAIEFNYGGQEGNSQVFNYGDFVTTMQISEVNIPVELRFKFNSVQYCASIELSRNFENGSKAMTVGKC